MKNRTLNLDSVDEQLSRKYHRDISMTHELENVKASFKKFNFKTFLFNHFPLLKLVLFYKVRSDLLNDLFAGINVGVATIAQAIGYAKMLRVPAQYGLYGTIFPTLIYSIFTSSLHSTCTFNIAGVIFINDALETLGYNKELIEDNGNSTGNDDLTPTMSRRLEAIYALTCISGVVIILGTLCRLGILARFNSEPHMSAVFASTIVTILINQLPVFLGIRVDTYSGLLQTPRRFVEVLKHISSTNIATLIISTVTLVFISGFKMFIDPKFTRRFSVVFPIDIFVIVFATAISSLWDWEGTFSVDVTGHIPSSMPEIKFPLGSNWTDFVKEGVVIGILTFINCPIDIKHFAVRHNYKVDIGQEMFGLGISTALSSGLSCAALGVSTPRFFMMESCGSKTQLAQIIAALASFVSVLFLTGYAETLPDCVVSAIIVCSFSKAFMNFSRLRKYWRSDKIFLFLWLFSFTVSMTSTVSNAILFGLCMSIFVTALRTMYSPINVLGLGYVGNKEYMLPTEHYHSLQAYAKIKIISLNGPLFYANSADIKDKIIAMLPLPSNNHAYVNSIMLDQADDKIETVSNIVDINSYKITENINIENNSISTLIFDMSRVNFTDTSALREIQSLKLHLNNKYQICLKLAACNESIRTYLSWAPKVEALLKEEMFATIEDAIYSAQHQSQKLQVYDDIDDEEDTIITVM